MNKIKMQELFDNCKEHEVLSLPKGEYEGPFVLRRACKIKGNSTTLWAKQGPVMQVEAGGVLLRDLRLEVTRPSVSSNDWICLFTKTKELSLENVQINGSIKGIPGEEGGWSLPSVLDLGTFPAEKAYKFEFQLQLPVKAVLYSEIEGITVSTPKGPVPPESLGEATGLKLEAGLQLIQLAIAPLKANTYIYGELLLKSSLVRRIVVAGKVKAGCSYGEGKLLYEAGCSQSPQIQPKEPRAKQSDLSQDNPQDNPQDKTALSSNVLVPVADTSNTVELVRGQKTAVTAPEQAIRITFTSLAATKGLALDPYIFLLDEQSKVGAETNMVFFGNPVSACGGVQYLEEQEKSILVELTKIPLGCKKIVVAYSIYGENLSHNFSQIDQPLITWCSLPFSEGQPKTCFCPDGLVLERTIVGIELYRYKEQWKLNPVGSGYRNGLKVLCESFGLEVV